MLERFINVCFGLIVHYVLTFYFWQKISAYRTNCSAF